jgi:murein DD-endopeptidase MepM/ murein hydrolase activator NlpD
MFNKASLLILISIFFLNPYILLAQNASILVSPNIIIQGDPILVQIDNISKLSDVKKLTFEGKKVGTFVYQKKVSGLIPIDLNKKIGEYEILAELSNGEVLRHTVSIGQREKYEAPLGIPEKLGGDTKESQDKLVATLASDKQSVTGLKTNKNSLWSKAFVPPLKELYVTSPYGYSRKTGEYSIPHKGTDYRAKDGTPVLSINRGVIRRAQSYRNYGKSIFIDHGQGLVSYYLHLSKYKVKVGQVVEAGQVIGQSGHSGYTLGAHLHLGIKINEITIDPEKFFELFK